MTDGGARRGRWRSGDQSRKRVLEAARACFGERGYDRTTIRSIADRADVDPAMVHYFFESKARLFSIAMELPPDVPERLATQLDADLRDLGERLVRQFLRAWDQQDGARQLLALMRSAPTDSTAASMFAEFMEREIVARLRDALGGDDDAELRAELIGSQLMGLALMRYVVRVEPLASADPADLVPPIGAAIQRYVDGTKPD